MDTFNYQTINYDEVTKFIKENGYVVIDNLFSKSYCDNQVKRTINAFQTINPNLNHMRKETWKAVELPPQTRTGMFQSLISNISPVREVRENENYKRIFSEIYSRVKPSYNVGDDLMCSIDGINFKPNSRGPYFKSSTKDWAHLDQTKRDDIYKCLQGQVVLSNTSACFVCSPKSHKLHNEIMKICGVKEKDSSNWCKIPKDKYSQCQKLVEDSGGAWQIPIKVKAGSCILWFSTTIHSARHSEKMEEIRESDLYLGYRCVYYITYRPKSEFTEKQIEKIINNMDHNRNMNHWNTRTFPILPNAGYFPKSNYCEKIQSLIDNPKLIYELGI